MVSDERNNDSIPVTLPNVSLNPIPVSNQLGSLTRETFGNYLVRLDITRTHKPTDISITHEILLLNCLFLSIISLKKLQSDQGNQFIHKSL